MRQSRDWLFMCEEAAVINNTLYIHLAVIYFQRLSA